jgi:hypothetical protein
MYRKGKGIRKRDIYLLLSLFLHVFGEKFPTAEFILNDFGRNFLLEIEGK